MANNSRLFVLLLSVGAAIGIGIVIVPIVAAFLMPHRILDRK